LSGNSPCRSTRKPRSQTATVWHRSRTNPSPHTLCSVDLRSAARRLWAAGRFLESAVFLRPVDEPRTPEPRVRAPAVKIVVPKAPWSAVAPATAVSPRLHGGSFAAALQCWRSQRGIPLLAGDTLPCPRRGPSRPPSLIIKDSGAHRAPLQRTRPGCRAHVCRLCMSHISRWIASLLAAILGWRSLRPASWTERKRQPATAGRTPRRFAHFHACWVPLAA
jgi:hypothetical protein